MSTVSKTVRNWASAALVLMLMLFAFAMYTAINKAIAGERHHLCVRKMMKVSHAAWQYSREHTNQLPHAATWCDDIKPWAHEEKFYLCPSGKREFQCHYAFNAKLSGLNPTNVHPETVMFFETTGGWNLSGGPELAVSPRHRYGNCVVSFADGSVLTMNEARFKTLRWDP
ncbi:MAG: hypothetical protein JWM68_1393 [Verrucomicrobiales bacterium]|nr:hypothetical protein [Verrucomicrobiales bacterium]